jgi:hypothetical protein
LSHGFPALLIASAFAQVVHPGIESFASGGNFRCSNPIGWEEVFAKWEDDSRG